MLFNSALVSSFFFTSAVLADRHREQPRSQFLDHVEQTTATGAASGGVNSYWAGAVWIEGNQTFDSITGTFTVPHPSGPVGSAATAFVGLDGYSCTNAMLMSAVDFVITENGTAYQAWYQWYPGPVHYCSNFSISAGDVIRANVTAFSATSGLATIENLTNGQYKHKHFNSTHPLCRQNAEWVVTEIYLNGGLAPLINFGTMTFKDSKATGHTGTYTPHQATVVDIERNSRNLTSVSVRKSSVTIKHV